MNRIISWVMFAGLLVLTACGGGNTASTNTPPPTTATTSAGTAQVGVTLGDAAADRIVSFEITITSFVLTDSTGKSVTVLASTDPPRKFELTHLSATVEPVAFLKIPAGTYTAAQIGWANPEVTFLTGTPGTTQLVEKESTATGTANVTFSPNLVISATSVLNLDLDVLKAVTIDFTTNPPTVTVNPSQAFSLTSAKQVAEADEDENEKGELEDVVGTIIQPAPTSSSLTIKTTAGATMTFAMDTTTKIELEGVSALALNMIVKVEGITKADGTFFAKEVEAEADDDVNGLEAEGLVSAIGTNQFSLVVHETMGSSMATMPGKPVTVNTNANTKFLIDNKNNRVNLSGFGFAQFNSVSLAQQVEADADTPMATGAITANRVKLEQQALRGTISNLASDGSSFTLTLSSDSAFALITGANPPTVTVFKSTAVVKPGASVANGSAVRVRGLLFLDSTTTPATYKMVAGRITP